METQLKDRNDIYSQLIPIASQFISPISNSESIMSGLVELTRTTSTMGSALFSFFNQYLLGERRFFPDSYLLPSERAALCFNQFGAVVQLTQRQREMLVLNFCITRIVITMLLKPREALSGAAARGTALRNLQVANGIGGVCVVILVVLLYECPCLSD